MAVPYLFRQNMLKRHFIFQQICKQFDTISFNTWFIFSSDQHNYETSRQCNIKPSSRTNKYGKYSIIASAVDLWNKVQK